jgi:Flp pilus assembly protein TadD
MLLRTTTCLILLAWAIISTCSAAQAQPAEVAPGVTVTRKVYPVPVNEAPFFNFAELTPSQRAANESFVREFLQRIPDRSEAAQTASDAGWQALFTRGDYATAARRFNQAYLLSPNESMVYHGFAAVAASRFHDFEFADELFRIAARMNSPSKALRADHGRVLLMAGRPHEAKPLLESAVRDDPDWAVPKSNLAWALLQTGDVAAACRLAAEVSGRDFTSVERDLALLKQRANCR